MASLVLFTMGAGCLFQDDECAGLEGQEPDPVNSGDYISAPEEQNTVLTHPHVLANEEGVRKDMTVDRAARTVTVRYTLEGEDVVETWAF